MLQTEPLEVPMRLAIVLVLSLVSCGPKKTSPEPVADVEGPAAAPPMSRDAILNTMHGNLSKVHDAHGAVIRGDLEGATTSAAALQRIPNMDGFPEPWIDKQMDLQMAAGYASRSQTIEDAANRVVAVGVRCAKCHLDVSDGPQFIALPEPAETGELKSHMQHHVWGADLMWKGVIAPDPELFQKGARGLAATTQDHPTGDERAEQILSIEQLVHAEAAAAALLTDAESQAKAYGSILARCATCHKAAGVEPVVVFNPMVAD